MSLDIQLDREKYPFPKIGVEDVLKAYIRIKDLVHRTPVLTSEFFNQQTGKELFFKCENLQKVGAFKFRGACNAVLQLSKEEAKHGVVTHSSGNHAQALALAAHKHGIPAYIVMPSNAPLVKKQATKGYGANIIECEPTLIARETTAEKVVKDTGATFIHPYNNLNIIAGQGTIAVEMLDQIPQLDIIIAPIGGGGMISGIAIAAKGLNPHIKIVAAEPLGANDAFLSKESGVFVPQTAPKTIADGLLTSMGPLTWPIVRDCVDAVITVDESQIRAALKLVFTRLKVVIEPSAAVGVAVALSSKFKDFAKDSKRVGIVLCGGNIDIENYNFKE